MLSARTNPYHRLLCFSRPVTGMDASVLLSVLHRNKLGFEEFIGQANLPLSQIKRIDGRIQWLDLEGKSGKSTSKQRGQLQVNICQYNVCSLLSAADKAVRYLE